MSTFTWNPKYGSAVNNTPSVFKAQFGDGYQQRVGKGINNLTRVWAVTFKLDIDEIDAIDQFLKTAGGVTNFDWTPPNGAAGKWVCETWGRSSDDGYDTISATFTEVFGD